MPREDEFAEFPGEPELTALGDAPRRFTPQELIACEDCLRPNAPTRMNCLYCGAPLPVTEQTAELRRPTLKKLEEWEQGINIILLPHSTNEAAHETIEEAASFLRLESSRLKELIDAHTALPLARAASNEEAELITKRLSTMGFKVEAIPDETLKRRPMRTRALAFDEDALVCFSSFDAEPCRLPWSKVALLVVGRVVTKRVEVAERKAKLSSRSDVVESREFAADEAALDIYSPVEEGEGFRIMADNFDYTCLGAGKGLLARDNFGALVKAIVLRAPSALLDEEYARMRGLLTVVWPPTEQTGSLGLRRERPGKFSTEAVTNISNETQFTCYARLRLQLVLRGQ